MFFYQLVQFVIAILFIIYLPIEGIASFGSFTLTGWRRILIIFVIGVAFSTLVDYTFSLFSSRYLVFPILLSFASLGIYRFTHWCKYIQKDLHGPHQFLLLLTLLYSLSVTSSGWFIDKGLILRGINAYDSVWNLALINELSEKIPPEHPGISGIPLKGYHVFYNLWVSTISRFTNIDVTALHFHFFAFILSTLLVYSCYYVGLRLSHKSSAALWSTFFALFGGSFSYIIPIFFHKVVSIDDAFGITQPASLLVSPSFVSSLLIILVTFILMDEYARRPNFILGIFLSTVSGVAIGFKVYAAMIVLPTLALFAIYLSVVRKRNDGFLVFFGSVALALGVFFPLNASYGFLRYQPLWPPHRVMQGSLEFTNWELKRQTLEQLGANLGLYKLEVIAFVIFLFGNLGTRIIGLLGITKQSFLSVSPILIFFWLAIGISFFIPMFFIQPIGAFNMIQLFWYFLVFVGILAGFGIYEFLSRFSKYTRYVLATVIIIFTVPSALEKLIAFAPLPTSQVSITTGEMKLYNILNRLGTYHDTVLVIPALPTYTKEELTRWFWRSSPPKIGAFAHKRTFLTNEGVQFPYEEWIQPRIELLALFMDPQGKLELSEEELFLARNSLQVLKNSYRIRFILSELPQAWFANEPRVTEIRQSVGLTLYEVLPL